jgi:hypothetical protein
MPAEMNETDKVNTNIPDYSEGEGVVKAPPAQAFDNARSLDGHPTDEIRVLSRTAEVAGAARATPRTIAREKYFNTGDAGFPQFLAKGTGPFMSVAHIHLIFWGAEWVGAAPPVDPLAVRAAVGSICGSAYMDAAYQYGNFGSVSWKTFFMQSATEPPANFPDSSVSNLLTTLFSGKLIPLPDSENLIDQFYVVFMPSTATSGTAGAGGKHKVFNWTNPATNKSMRVRYAWTLNNSSLDFVTTVFSHELVEAYTDPEGTYIQIQPGNANNWNEVGDICSSVGYVDGIAVQTYWSQQDQACVIPYYVDHGFPHGVPPNGARLKVIGIRRTYSKNQRLYFISEFRVQAPNGDTFHISRTDAEVSILKKKNTYYVHGNDGTEADVKIFTRPGTNSTYLATVPDSSKADNLLSLPGF